MKENLTFNARTIMSRMRKRSLFHYVVGGIFLAAGVTFIIGALQSQSLESRWADIRSQFLPSTAAPIEEAEIPREVRSSTKKKTSRPVDSNEQVEFLPLPAEPFAVIDKHARECPKTYESDIETLAMYLQKVATTDLEKARSIYVWLSERISYDDRGFNSNLNGDYSALGVLKYRTAVCEGFSNLYYALGKQMGLPIEKVSGYSKGYSYRPGQRFSRPDHAWNVIKINDQWRVFDATWGRGYGRNVGGKLVSTKKFSDSWFDVDPYEAIFTHFPEDPMFANVEPQIDLNIFQELPYIRKEYFDLGFDGHQAYKDALANQGIRFPDCYALNTYVRINTAPKLSQLELHTPYYFELNVPRGISVALIDAKGHWKYFDPLKGVFKLTYEPSTKGELKLAVKHEKSGRSFETILVYKVISPKQSV